MGKTFFISDLHLQADEPRATEIFLRFLQQSISTADALYILGDLFEVWVGDDDLSPFNVQIMQALKQVTDSGLPVFFMRGNRDFLIGKRFASRTGVKLLPDPTVIDLYGARTLLMHGDSLCTFDEKHQKTRRFTLNPVCQWLALRLPLRLRRRAGVWLRGKSRQHLQRTANDVMDVNPAAVIAALGVHQATRLIHGHTHRPGIYPERIVLGAWHDAGSVLVCDDEQGYQLQTWND